MNNCNKISKEEGRSNNIILKLIASENIVFKVATRAAQGESVPTNKPEGYLRLTVVTNTGSRSPSYWLPRNYSVRNTLMCKSIFRCSQLSRHIPVTGMGMSIDAGTLNNNGTSELLCKLFTIFVQSDNSNSAQAQRRQPLTLRGFVAVD